MKIRKICANRSGPDWLKDQVFSGCSVDETAKSGKCQVKERYLKVK